ncbi:unnamed protein product [Rotaria sp. Silwood2]|nr:unnamed protein product [Rotaria sp. Silwood2]CAF4137064.1 unnamed protein product [Rotaria sp. Silwood2]CAF4261402.1 unnamed protein product [Rotaria sp. Silwood2]
MIFQIYFFAIYLRENTGVIVNIYGKNSDLIVDRQAEIQYMIHLAQFHISPSIVLTFNNGFIYEYLPGSPVSNGDEEKASHLNHIPWLKITGDINKIEKIIDDKSSQWSNLSNVLFDIINHFIEYAGSNNEEPDYDNTYPQCDKQKQWLEIYLSNALFLNDKFEKQMTIDELCDLGDCLRAPIHLYWSLLAFLEALLSPESMKKFDYIRYGRCRLKQYEKYKQNFFSSVKKINVD